MSELNARMGREVQALRRRRGCTLSHVASASGLSRSYLSEVERGRANVSLGLVEKLAEAFDVDPLALLGGDSAQFERRLRAESRMERIRAILDEA